jgi:predicted transcriptional regulator
MTAAELNILRIFRRYRVRPAEMLFVSPTDWKTAGDSFSAAMRCLIEKGLVVKEHPHHAYSLTEAGYELSRSASVDEPPVKLKRRCPR